MGAIVPDFAERVHRIHGLCFYFLRELASVGPLLELSYLIKEGALAYVAKVMDHRLQAAPRESCRGLWAQIRNGPSFVIIFKHLLWHANRKCLADAARIWEAGREHTSVKYHELTVS